MNKILLVNPHETTHGGGLTTPPLGLLYIAGTLLNHRFDVQLIDGCLQGKESIRSRITTWRPDIVGITCLTPGRKKALEVAQMTKNVDPNIRVVMGGVHPTIMYRQILEHYPFVDFVVLGEGEQTCLELAEGKKPFEINGLAYRAEGKVLTTASRTGVPNLDELPFPAWNLVDLRKYPAAGNGVIGGIDLAKEPRASIIFSRGCTGSCNFCSSWWIWREWRHRSPRNMADEIEVLYRTYGMRYFSFEDDTMTVDRVATLELCDEIVSRELKIVFELTTRVDCVDEAILGKLKEAGCYKIALGIETGSNVLLEKMGKKTDTATAERAIQLVKRAGISVTALLIVGNVGETSETVSETVQFLRRTRPDELGSVGGLWILPGTMLYQACKRRGFIDDDFWLHDEPYKTYTLDFSPEQLAEFERRIYRYDDGWVEWVLARVRPQLRRMRRLLSRQDCRISRSPETRTSSAKSLSSRT